MVDATVVIDELWPRAGLDLDDDALLRGDESAAGRRRVRASLVASVDGSATLAGLSGGLGDAADRRMFGLLRRPCDAVLVGAGTVRAEGYGGELVDAAARRWRFAHGFAEHPRLAIVSGDLALDPASDVFALAPVRPLVITRESAPADRRAALAAVADVVVCGAASVDLVAAVEALARRGLGCLHCEGGPRLLGSLAAEGLLDELCLTVGPVLVAGDGPRIAAGPEAAVPLRLDRVLRSGYTLLLRYARRGEGGAP